MSYKLSFHPDALAEWRKRCGNRLIYEVRDAVLLVIVVAVGVFERSTK